MQTGRQTSLYMGALCVGENIRFRWQMFFRVRVFPSPPLTQADKRGQITILKASTPLLDYRGAEEGANARWRVKSSRWFQLVGTVSTDQPSRMIWNVGSRKISFVHLSSRKTRRAGTPMDL